MYRRVHTACNTTEASISIRMLIPRMHIYPKINNCRTTDGDSSDGLWFCTTCLIITGTYQPDHIQIWSVENTISARAYVEDDI
jgi:hypothetical protein